MRIWPGRSYPLGATWDGAGVNFALFSEHATKVELCLFDSADAGKEAQRIPLKEHTDKVWHCLPARRAARPALRLPRPRAVRAGQGASLQPQQGRCSTPTPRPIGRDVRWDDALFGYKIGDPEADLSFDDRDSAAFAPLAAVIDPAFTWGDDRPPRTPWHKTIIYELHVKGFTKRHPGVPEKLRGTYAGLASEAAIKHLTDLGVTAVELMPVHHHLDDRHLVEKGLRNYWGYNTLGFFAPDLRYAHRPDRRARRCSSSR